MQNKLKNKAQDFFKVNRKEKLICLLAAIVVWSVIHFWVIDIPQDDHGAQDGDQIILSMPN